MNVKMPLLRLRVLDRTLLQRKAKYHLKWTNTNSPRVISLLRYLDPMSPADVRIIRTGMMTS